MKSGWVEQPNGDPTWPLDHYFNEGKRTTNWITEGVVKYHRTITTYMQSLMASGFAVRRLAEWAPTAEELVAHPEWAKEVHRPMFLIVSADAT